MRALVADDDRVTATIVMNLLKSSTVEVSMVHDGSAAWELLSSDTPPALAIVDWMMPGIDGLELCRRIRQEPRLAKIHIILLTGKRDQTDVVAGLDAGADDYIVKPFQFEQLRTRVHAGVRIAMLRERMAQNVAEVQAADKSSGTAALDIDTRRGWLELAKDGVTRSQRYRRPLGGLMQAAGDVVSREVAPPLGARPDSPIAPTPATPQETK
jgi:two-component system, cell cycle response regulator